MSIFRQIPPDSPINLTKTSALEISQLRQRILRRGMPISTAVFAGDNLPSTIHAAAFCCGEIVGCVTLIAEDMPQNSPANLNPGGGARRMRGMAVDTYFQRRKIGAALTKYAEFLALERGGSLIWLSARIHAVAFYQKMGYTTFGEEYDIEAVGRHINMYKILSRHKCDGCANGGGHTKS